MEEREVFRFWLCSVFSYKVNTVMHFKFGAIFVNKPNYIVEYLIQLYVISSSYHIVKSSHHSMPSI